MSLSSLPLSYCTNVHPGQTVDEIVSGLKTYTIPARKQLRHRIAAGLWLASAVVEELQLHPERLQRIQSILAEGDLICYTLNTFPYGNFHSERVKENVYIPDWTTPQRLHYTVQCAHLLTQLLPAGVEGSLSTVPLGFKTLSTSPDFLANCIRQLLTIAAEFDRLHDETGQVIRLAIEPEPCCVLETIGETRSFFDQLFAAAEQSHQLDIARRHLGVCFDVCHQAVEFENILTAVQSLADADIRINKVHLTCALHLDHPAGNLAARQQLAAYAEPRYLHQTFARSRSGTLTHTLDLTPELCLQPPSEFDQADAWRIHFHVPVHREQVGLLKTTRPELREVIAATARLDYAPHLEVETYTWGVLPEEQPASLSAGLVSELQATQSLIDAQRAAGQTSGTDPETPASA